MNRFKKLPYLPQKVWLYIHFPSIKWIRVSSHQKELLADYISWSTNTINFHVECVKIVAKLCGHNRKREHVGPTEHEGNCHKVKPSPHPRHCCRFPEAINMEVERLRFQKLMGKISLTELCAFQKVGNNRCERRARRATLFLLLIGFVGKVR